MDIETGAQSLENVKAVVGEFDESNVSLGNLKDPDKIRQKIEEARASYDADILEKAALSPLTANVVSVTYQLEEGILLDIDIADEFGLLTRFWEHYSNRDRSSPLSGWNILGFDLPMLRNRSLLLGVPMPMDAWSYSPTTGLTNWLGVLDLLPYFRGTRGFTPTGANQAGWSLDEVCKAFGMPGKVGDGSRFASLVRSGDPAKLEKAIIYGHDDVLKCSGIGQKFGFRVSPQTRMLFEPRSASHGFLAARNEVAINSIRGISSRSAKPVHSSELPEDEIPFEMDEH